MQRNHFEALVREVIEALPPNIKEAMENVAFVVDPVRDRPAKGRSTTAPRRSASNGAREVAIRAGETLLGLYEGVPKTKRGAGYSGALPDKITIFQKPIEELAGGDEKKLKKLVYEVVWHEVGHHLGFDEPELRTLEKKRKLRGNEIIVL